MKGSKNAHIAFLLEKKSIQRPIQFGKEIVTYHIETSDVHMLVSLVNGQYTIINSYIFTGKIFDLTEDKLINKWSGQTKRYYPSSWDDFYGSPRK